MVAYVAGKGQRVLAEDRLTAVRVEFGMTLHDDRAVEALNDTELRAEAAVLAPELFAALAIAHGAERERFPLESASDLQAVLESLVGDEDQFRSRGVSFSVQVGLDNFPEGFFPVEDRADLLRKAYMVISGTHAVMSRNRFDAYEGDFTPSHPMPEGIV